MSCDQQGYDKPITRKKIKRKTTPKYKIFALYWWNPFIYLALAVYFVLCAVGEGAKGVAEWKREMKELITDYNWK